MYVCIRITCDILNVNGSFSELVSTFDIVQIFFVIRVPAIIAVNKRKKKIVIIIKYHLTTISTPLRKILCMNLKRTYIYYCVYIFKLGGIYLLFLLIYYGKRPKELHNK